MRNDFLQVKTEKLLDTEKPQRTSSRALEWLSGESISPLPNACLKAIPSIIFQKLKTEQIPCLQLCQLRGHIITVKTDELKYFFARTNYDSSINNSRLLLILCRHWYHGVLQVSSLIITWCLNTKLCILNTIYTSISLNLFLLLFMPILFLFIDYCFFFFICIFFVAWASAIYVREDSLCIIKPWFHCITKPRTYNYIFVMLLFFCFFPVKFSFYL